jgi:hypothetical protein
MPGELGPNFSAYPYEEFPVYFPTKGRATVHISRNTWGLDTFTVPEAAPEWLEMMRGLAAIQKMPPAEWLEWVDRLHQSRRIRKEATDDA